MFEQLTEIEQLIAMGVWIQAIGAIARLLTPIVKNTTLWDRLPRTYKWVPPAVFALLASAGSAALLTESWSVFGVVVVANTVLGALSAVGLYHGPVFLGGNATKNAEPIVLDPDDFEPVRDDAGQPLDPPVAKLRGLPPVALLFLLAALLIGCSTLRSPETAVEAACTDTAYLTVDATCQGLALGTRQACDAGSARACLALPRVVEGCEAIIDAQDLVCAPINESKLETSGGDAYTGEPEPLR